MCHAELNDMMAFLCMYAFDDTREAMYVYIGDILQAISSDVEYLSPLLAGDLVVESLPAGRACRPKAVWAAIGCAVLTTVKCRKPLRDL